MKLLRTLVCLAIMLPATVLVAQSQPIASQDQAIIPLDQVRTGMKGYGLTVFQADKIEPFPVEVISVMSDSINGPKNSVIWIRCPDERMQKTGPVSGMSGSPIYLWDERQEPDEMTGGRLAGAFALGFSGGKDCYVGVQPIEQMRDVATRADLENDPQANARKANHLTMVHLLNRYAKERGLDTNQYWRLNALAENTTVPAVHMHKAGGIQTPAGMAGQAQTMLLPLPLRSSQLADSLTALLAPLGMRPHYNPMASVISRPPAGIDAENIVMRPGSVICVPLAFGDLDYSASGTVTDILPDGTILAFGHAMYGQGDAALPVASGYVHFIQPGLASSFKLASSGVIRGALVRDENAAIIAHADGRFDTAKVKVTIKHPDYPTSEFNYQVVVHPQMTPMITAITAIESLLAKSELPDENTLRIKADMQFDGGRDIQVNAIAPMGDFFNIFMELVPPASALMYNEFEMVALKSADIDIEMVKRVELSYITGGRVARTELAPGETLPITVRLQPFGQPITSQTVSMTIPETLPDGNYQVLVCDPQTYLNLTLKSQPHLAAAYSVDDLLAIYRLIASVPGNAMYLMIQSPEAQSLAIGREQLPALPSSRFAMIANPTDTLATPYAQWITRKIETENAITGVLNFPITVKRQPGK